ncbi:MAG: pilus assembly protein PilB [Planctomycetes bacterium DG_23]|nr:MAG: pilus assembly protein PilB [Planctomycetes bacterium DG_23]
MKKPIGEILKDMGLVTDEQIEEALTVQRQKGGVLGEILVSLGYVNSEQVLDALGQQFGMEAVNLEEMEIPREIVERVSAAVARSYRIMPVSWDGQELTVAMADPLNIGALDELRFVLDSTVRGAISSPEAVDRALEKYYGRPAAEKMEEIAEQIGRHEDVPIIDEREAGFDLEKLKEATDAAPVRRLVNYVLLQAVKDQATDVHFEPFEDEFKIRYRIDGVLYEMVPPPKHLGTAITSRLKVMSGLNISERRRPQDGRIRIIAAGHPVDLRISVLPTQFGESTVIRVLDRRAAPLDLELLGMRQDELERFRQHFSRPHGIILVTGPTGCGKTTTLYSALMVLNDIATKIITTEDPVEFDLEGIVQVQVNEAIGVTFGRCLRHILRQDPDKILVGEIRDLETGQLAIQASLTGHLVMSTLHTNDAPTAITRLIDMGLEPYLINATLEAVIAERLIRKICTQCKSEYAPSKDELMELQLNPEDVAERKFYYGRGCKSCNHTGYHGRTGIFEIMSISDELRELISYDISTSRLRQAAVRTGMRTLRESGLLKIYDGVTTIEEVARQTLVGEV